MHKNRISVHIIFALLEKDRRLHYFTTKVEKILKRILDLIPSPSPSVKIQIMSGKPFAGNNFWKQKNCIHYTAMYILPQVNFPANNLNFYWRWRDHIRAISFNFFYSLQFYLLLSKVHFTDLLKDSTT